MIEEDFYSLIELVPMVNLQYKQLQNRLKVVREKYGIEKDKLYKKSNRWFIHKCLINEFDRKVYYIDYKLFITIAAQNKTNIDYWRFIVKTINKRLKGISNSFRIKYVVESKNQNYHLHFITNCNNRIELRKIFNDIPELTYLNKINVDITNVYEIKGLHNYFRKQNKPVLLK